MELEKLLEATTIPVVMIATPYILVKIHEIFVKYTSDQGNVLADKKRYKDGEYSWLMRKYEKSAEERKI